MEKKNSSGTFPVGGIKASLITAAVIFALCGVIMRHQAFFSVKTSALLASFGRYEAAMSVLSGIDVNSEAEYYKKGLYGIADAMYERSDYESACQKFLELGDYSDSGDRVCRCQQKIAEDLIAKKDYMQANDILSDILFFSGSRELYNECQYRYAKEKIDGEDWFVGAQILWNMKGYKDAEDIARKAVYDQTGSENPEEALNSSAPLSPEQLGEYLKLEELRGKLRSGSLAVGFFHTVGLKKNGRVVAVGNNEKGQCDTGSWEDIIQVAAGGYHTVGLRSDGTVVASGDNSSGQCNVSKWKDIVQIKATDYNTVALRKDGKILTCGFNKLTKAHGWTAIDRICTGAYAVCGLNKPGDLFCTHPSCALEGELIDADFSISYGIGLTKTGDVLFTSDTPCEWSKAVAVFAGGDHVAVIDQNEKPLVYHRRKAMYYSLPEGRAVDIALGGTHIAILYDDGSVYCAGLNDDGQCDTSDWNLN